VEFWHYVPSRVSPCGPWPWDSHWHRRFHEISRHEDHVCLFCSFTSATRHPPLGTYDCLPLVSCLVLLRLDYCNAVLAGIPLHLARRLQSVMNAAARLVFASSKCDHIIPLLRQSHCLKIPWWITSWPFWFTKLSSWPGTVIPRWRTSSSSRVWVSKASIGVIAGKTVIHVWAPCMYYKNERYMNILTFYLFLFRLTNCLFLVSACQTTATELFQSPLYRSGTVFRSISRMLRHFLSSALACRHTSSNSVTRNYCCRARKVTLSFMDTLIALTYLWRLISATLCGWGRCFVADQLWLRTRIREEEDLLTYLVTYLLTYLH